MFKLKSFINYISFDFGDGLIANPQLNQEPQLFKSESRLYQYQ